MMDSDPPACFSILGELELLVRQIRFLGRYFLTYATWDLADWKAWNCTYSSWPLKGPFGFVMRYLVILKDSVTDMVPGDSR